MDMNMTCPVYDLKAQSKCRTGYFEASRRGADLRSGSAELPHAVKVRSSHMVGTAIRPNW